MNYSALNTRCTSKLILRCGPTRPSAVRARTRMAVYKRPRWIEFVDDFPETAERKIQRYLPR